MKLYDRLAYDVMMAEKLHGGGTPFFDYLDERMRHAFVFEQITRMIADANIGPLPNIVVSGRFGEAYARWANGKHVAIMPGELRHRPVPDDGTDPQLRNSYVFLDDSIYKGRTLAHIREYLERWGSKITDAWVLYDGSLPPHIAGVNYIYRWHRNGIREGRTT